MTPSTLPLLYSDAQVAMLWAELAADDEHADGKSTGGDKTGSGDACWSGVLRGEV